MKLYFIYYRSKLCFNNLFFLDTWPLEYVIYTATLPSALTGADVAIFAAAFSYISDVSTRENRTLRVTILDVIYLSTMPTGIALGNSFKIFFLSLLLVSYKTNTICISKKCPKNYAN